MNVLDVILVLAAIASALAGFRHGFVVAICSLTGFVAGAWLGLQAAPLLLGAAPRVFSTALVALLIVLGLAYGGQVLGTALGRRLRTLIVWRPGRLVDAGAGAVTGVVYVLVVSWALGLALAGSGLALAGPVRGSAVLGAVDDALPDGSDDAFQSFTRLLDRTGFPAVFAPFATETIVPVEPPTADESLTPAVGRAAASVVRVFGTACRDTVTGSGFVTAPGVVVTNAHVVAGIEEPQVIDSAGRQHRSTVIGFDALLDIAVLDVPGLSVPALPYGSEARAPDPVAVLGYPGGGPYQATPGRVRTVRTIAGPDIYDDARVTREVYALRADVRPGNSGGPLVAADGSVLGVVFAASVTDEHTGYALTAAEVRPAVTAAIRDDAAVAPTACR